MLKNYFAKWRDYLPFWISLIVAIIISSISLHFDFIVVSKIAQKVANGNLHIYEDLFIGNVNMGKSIFPPFICLVDGFFYFIIKQTHLLNFDFNLTDRIPMLQLLLLKSRYILVFILSYPLIYKVALLFTNHEKEHSRRIANLWIASPILIYLPFAQGNNDIYPAVLSLVFLFFAFRKNFILAMILLGLTAAMKNYALLLVIPVALIFSEKDLKKTALYCLTSGAFYYLWTLIYPKAVAASLAGNVENYLMLKTAIPTFTTPYSIFAIGYCLILLFLYFGDNIKEMIAEKSKMLVTYCFLIMSLFYITWYWPQWFLWILPFFVLLIYKNKKLYTLYLLITSTYFLYTYVWYPANLDLSLWKQILPALDAGKRYYPAGIIPANPAAMSFIVGFFVSLIFVFAFFLLKERGESEKHDDRISIYLSYLPTAILLLAMGVFAYIAIYFPKM